MKAHSVTSHVLFDQPAIYQITVQGRVPANWQDRLDGLTVTPIEGDSQLNASMLCGVLEDQAALAGVLNVLYGLHLSVLSLSRIDIPSQSA